MALPRTMRALESPIYRRYYIGQAVSMIGTWVQSVALMWLAYDLTQSTAFTGFIGLVNGLPYLVISPIAGVLGDRLPRRKILMTVLALLMLQAMALAVLTGLHIIRPWSLACLSLFAGLCNAFETPTRQSFFVQLLERKEDLPNAIALNSILMNGSRLVGPSLGGLIIAAFGETACFALNAVSYLAVLGALSRVRVVHKKPPRAASHPLADLAEGWRYAMGSLVVRRMLFTLAAVSFAIGPYTTLMPAIAVETYGKGAALVGLFIGAVGLGAVISAVTLARRSSIRGLGKYIGVAALMAGLGAAGFSFSRNVWISFGFMMLAGFGMFQTGSIINTILQSVVDEDKRSRVMAYFTMFFIGSAPLGHFAAGWLAEGIGAPRTFLVGGCIAFAAGAVFLVLLPSFRRHLRPLYVSRGIIPASEAGAPTQ